MISSLTGVLAGAFPDSPRGPHLVLSVHGVGFEIVTTARTLAGAPAPQAEITLHTHLVVREDALILVGFFQRAERDLFSVLQSASGVGLKVALAILNDLSIAEIIQAIMSDNHKPLTVAKGVGPKLAQKIVLELKEKMTQWRDHVGASDTGALGVAASNAAREAFWEAEAVLLSLGYSPQEIHAGLQGVAAQFGAGDPQSEDVLREALRFLASRV